MACSSVRRSAAGTSGSAPASAARAAAAIASGLPAVRITQNWLFLIQTTLGSGSCAKGTCRSMVGGASSPKCFTSATTPTISTTLIDAGARFDAEPRADRITPAKQAIGHGLVHHRDLDRSRAGHGP